MKTVIQSLINRARSWGLGAVTEEAQKELNEMQNLSLAPLPEGWAYDWVSLTARHSSGKQIAASGSSPARANFNLLVQINVGEMQ